MSNTEQVTHLRVKRGQIKAKLTRTQTILADFKDTDDVNLLHARRAIIQSTLSEFEIVQTELEALTPNDTTHDEQRGLFENQYCMTIALIQTTIDKLHPPKNLSDIIPSPTNSESSSSHNHDITLPPINLPTFNGNYSDWNTFIDSYNAIIHANNRIPDIKKFHYLKSCLEGEAFKTIESLIVSNANYDSAYNLLVKQYNNKRRIVQQHVNNILDSPNIQKVSHSSLRNLINDIQINLEALRIQEISTIEWDPLLIPILTAKLDYNSKRNWQETLTSEVPTLEQFLLFLERKSQILEIQHGSDSKSVTTNQMKFRNERVNARNNYHHNRYNSHNKIKNITTSHVVSGKNIKCMFCQKNHYIFHCPDFLNLPVQRRIKVINENNACVNCLRSHKVFVCYSRNRCRHCDSKHNSLLCIKHNQGNNAQSKASMPTSYVDSNSTEALSNTDSHTTKSLSKSDSQTAKTVSNAHSQSSHLSSNQMHSLPGTSFSTVHVNRETDNKYTNQVILPTAIVLLKDKQGRDVECRCLLDVGSQSNFITESMAKQLGLSVDPINHFISGITETITQIKYKTVIELASRYQSYTKKLSCFLIDNITGNQPQTSFTKAGIEIPKNICLADPTFNHKGSIDLLIGAEIFWELLLKNTITDKCNKPYLHETVLGWVFSGTVYCTHKPKLTATNLTLDMGKVLNKQLERFWDLENSAIKRPFTINEQKCEDIYTKTIARDQTGRYIVRLPFKQPFNLGSSEHVAKQRFFHLERKLNNDPTLKQQYSTFMSEYLSLNHMELVTEPELNKTNSFYLPHHAVFKYSLSSTSIRVVFDGSAKSTNGLSLNDNLLKGPTIQQDLFSILTRFRTFHYVLNADIGKMYRQVKVNQQDTDYQRIFWRENPNEELKTYRLTTVTYGTTSAPYLAIRSLHQLANEFKQINPTASNIIIRDFYVDDLLTGAKTISEAIQLRDDLTKILSSAGFDLCKWTTNSPDTLPVEHSKHSASINFDKNGETKTLGLIWNSQSDYLTYDVHISNYHQATTKRSILSMMAKIFDPLGLISPITVKIKLIMQKLWALKIGWDQPVPSELQLTWTQLITEFHIINQYRIPRKIILDNTAKTTELHGFADSSMQAFAAAIYIRTIDIFNNVHVQLLCSKSRVAPIKTISLPRLELCAAQLLARLSNDILKTLDVRIDNKFYWSDSTITLAWIKSHSNQWTTFVANRVGEIQSLTNIDEWHHIDSRENPADIPSRGMMPEHLKNNFLWWYGPSFLQELNWAPNVPAEQISHYTNEELKISRSMLVSNNSISNDVLTRYSSFIKLQRVMAFMLRFIHNSKEPKNRRIGTLSVHELQTAHNKIISLVQTESFNKEINYLKANKQLSSKSKILNLSPFLDEHGLLRVGGRLIKATIPYEQKHQLLLPKSHHITKLLVRQVHHNHLHAGAQATLSAMRQLYWPISGRSSIRSVLHQCVTCFKVKPVPIEQKMGNLPKQRLEPARPFFNTGVDYIGPINIKEGGRRSKKCIKSYIVLFICMCTKAIHLELVLDLTSESFLAAIKRFISRRGCVSHMFSDNSTTFVGAKRELDSFHKFLESDEFQNNIATPLSHKNIVWHFIPPKTPTQGGYWEANVKIVKHHFKRVVGETLLTYEEMYTFLTAVEACLNSRPLVPLSTDPTDFSALTPGHFLIGNPITTHNEPDLTELRVNRLSRWQLVQQMQHHFWKRWSSDYLTQLQVRGKWSKVTSQPLKPGTLVIIKEESLPPLQWQLGRIQSTFPGTDGVIRVVTVRTNKGLYKRGVNKLCVLPVDSQ